jgi:hypothetical protein
VTIPAVIERAGSVAFVVVDGEIAVLEPHEFDACRLDFRGIQLLGVDTAELLRGDSRLGDNAGKPAVAGKPVIDCSQSVETDRRAALIGR